MANSIPQSVKSNNPSSRTMSDSMEDAKSTLRDIAHEAGNNVRSFLDEASSHASELRHTTEEKITRHPFAAVGAAAVVGLLLGALLRR